jgi:endoglucanase
VFGAAGATTAVPMGAGPSLDMLATPWPNPSAGGTRFAIQLPEPGQVRLAIVDVAGRQVAILAQGALDAGRHEYEWTTAGSVTKPGIYWARLDADGRRTTRRFVILGDR